MPLPTYSEAELTAIIAEVIAFVRFGRSQFARSAVLLDTVQQKAMEAFFSIDVLGSVRIVPPDTARLQNLDFYYRARQKGFPHMPDFSHLGQITFEDTILFQSAITDRLLFHALVQVVQHRLLGLERYVDLYIRNFIRSGLHFLVPFEVHAYELDERFTMAPAAGFSVESEVRHWCDEGRYNPA